MWRNPSPQPGSWVSKSGGPGGTPKNISGATFYQQTRYNHHLGSCKLGMIFKSSKLCPTPARNGILLMCEKLQCQRTNILCPTSTLNIRRYLSPSSKDCQSQGLMYNFQAPAHLDDLAMLHGCPARWETVKSSHLVGTRKPEKVALEMLRPGKHFLGRIQDIIK